MNSIFQRARQSLDEEPEETHPIFEQIKEHKKSNIIPPVGIAKPELVQSFIDNMDDEEKIRKTIEDVESYERETPFQTIGRETLAHATRGAEALAGGLTSFVNAVIPDLFSEDETGKITKYKPFQLPGEKEFREKTKEETGNYLEPKNEIAKVTQETISDIGSMFSTPGLGFWQKLLTPIGGQITKQIIKASGGSEEAQDYGKLGFMGLSTIAQIGNAPQAAARALTQAEQMLPQGLRFSTRPTEQALNNIRNSQWYRTGTTPSKAPALREITRIENQIQNGTMDAHTAMQLRRDINEARRELGAFKLDRPADIRQTMHHLDEVDRALLSSIENYGQNVNPQWLRQYQLGNQAFAVTQRSRAISDFVAKHAKPLQSETARTLFHIAGTSGALNAPLIGASALPIMATAKGIQIMNRMIRSPVLRNHYMQVLTQASLGNAATTQKALKKFDLVSEKMEKKKDQ